MSITRSKKYRFYSHPMMKFNLIRKFPTFLVLKLLRGYQLLLSPWWSGCCRFYPSCSVYMVSAIHRFGLMRGGFLGIKRLMSCHPFGKEGFDPVPEQRKARKQGSFLHEK